MKRWQYVTGQKLIFFFKTREMHGNFFLHDVCRGIGFGQLHVFSTPMCFWWLCKQFRFRSSNNSCCRFGLLGCFRSCAYCCLVGLLAEWLWNQSAPFAGGLVEARLSGSLPVFPLQDWVVSASKVSKTQPSHKFGDYPGRRLVSGAQPRGRHR